MQLMLPAIIPFNLIKASANGVIGAILYIPLHKSVSKYLDKQVVTDEDLAAASQVYDSTQNGQINNSQSFENEQILSNDSVSMKNDNISNSNQDNTQNTQN